MNQPAHNSRNLLDLVFEGRNKQYGAYLLRLHYERTLCRALLRVLTFLSVLSILFHFRSRENSETPKVNTQVDPRAFYTVPVSMPPIPEPETETRSAAPPAASQEQATVIRDNAATPEEPASNAPAGTSTGTSTEPDAGETAIIRLAKESELKPDTVFESYTVEELPEFAGGIAALRRFIAANTRYPAEEAEQGLEGTVSVRFMVEENGMVSHVSVQHSAGPAFDKEAVRVVSLLPAFKSPGRTGGRAVKVMFALPIRFRIQ